MNLRTHHGDGGSPLWWAKKYHGKDSKVVKFLESKGAIDVAPDKEK
jgi:prolyl 4-hydroxylase